MDVTVVVGTFGEASWAKLAVARAIPSAEALEVPVIHCHTESLHHARNLGLLQVKTEWACFLDADDELTPGYFDAMSKGRGDVLVPSVQYVRNGRKHAPYIPRVVGHSHICESACLRDGNYAVVGSPVRTDLVRRVGGFKDWPIYEDFDLWQRCWLAGGEFESVPEAVYRAHARSDSRNRGMPKDRKHRWHLAINEANGVIPTWA